MAEKTQIQNIELEREYIIPLRSEWRKGANYRRAGKAIKAIKKFIARHMKVEERDIDKVKLDQWLNQEVWFRGKTKPPAKIKVRAKKESGTGIVRVELAELPDYVKYEKAKRDRLHKPSDKQAVTPKAGESAVEEKTEEQKKDEKEKEKAVAEVRATESKKDAKFQKSAGAKKKEPGFHRMALKK